MANNNAILTFGANVDKNSLEKIVEKAEEITKRKYDIVFKANSRGNLETYVKNYKDMIMNLKSFTLDGLNNLNTNNSVEQINFLVSALKQLNIIKDFDYVDTDENTITKLFNFDSLKKKIKKDLNLDFSSYEALIKSLETFRSRLEMTNSNIVKEYIKDSASVNTAISQYGNAIKNANINATKDILSSNEELMNQLNSINMVSALVNNYKSLGGNSRMSDFKTYLKNQFGNTEELKTFFDSITKQYGNSFKNFSNDIIRLQTSLTSLLQNKGVTFTNGLVKESMEKSYGKSLEQIQANDKIKNGDLKYTFNVDANQLKDVLVIIEDIKEQLSKIPKIEISGKVDEKLESKLKLISEYVSKISLPSINISNGGTESLTFKSISNEIQSLKNIVNDINKTPINITYTSEKLLELNKTLSNIEGQINNINKTGLSLTQNISTKAIKTQAKTLSSTLSNNIDLSSITKNLKLNDVKLKFKGFDKKNLSSTMVDIQKYINSKTLKLNIKGYDNKNLGNISKNIQSKLNNLNLKLSINTISSTNAIKTLKSKLKELDTKVAIKVDGKINNDSIKNIKSKIQAQLDNKISINLKSLNTTKAVADVKKKLSNIQFNQIPINLKIPSKKDLQVLINSRLTDTNNPINIKIAKFQADGAIDNLKQAIEEKLKSIGLTVNIKTTQVINDVQKLQNTSSSSHTTSKESANNIKIQNDALNRQFDIVKNIFNLEKERLDLQTKIATGQDITGKYSNQLVQIEKTISALKTSTQLSNEFKSIFSSNGFIDINKLEQLSNITESIKSNITNFEKEYQKALTNSQNSMIKNYEKQFNSSGTINKNIDSLLQKLQIGNNGENESVSKYITELISLQSELNNEINNYKNIINDIASGKKTFTSQQDGIKATIKNIDDMTNRYKILKSEVEKTFSTASTNTSQAKIDNSYSKFITEVAKFQSQNGKAMSSKYNYDAQLKQLISEANTSNRTKENLFGLQSRFNTIKTEINNLGKTGKSVGQELDNLFSKIGLKAIFGTMIYRAISYFKSMLTTVKEVNTSMVKLKRVTSETNDSYSKFLKSATQSAKELSSTITDIIDAVSSFSRLGYNIDDATILGNVATMYSNVGFIDIDTATSDLVTAMKAFNIEADNSISIINAFNEVGNKFALSSADIGEGLTQSASALAVGGNNLNESIAMITGITEITQDSASAGNALKTLSLRLRGTKVSLEEAGEDIDGMAETTSKMRENIKALSGVDIMLDKDNYKSTYQIMREISNVWNDLTDVKQAGLLELIAGKTRANLNCPYVQKCA